MSDKEIALKLTELEVQLRCAEMNNKCAYTDNVFDIYKIYLSMINISEGKELE